MDASRVLQSPEQLTTTTDLRLAFFSNILRLCSVSLLDFPFSLGVEQCLVDPSLTLDSCAMRACSIRKQVNQSTRRHKLCSWLRSVGSECGDITSYTLPKYPSVFWKPKEMNNLFGKLVEGSRVRRAVSSCQVKGFLEDNLVVCL